MADEAGAPGDLYSFAEASVKRIGSQAPTAWTRELIEDAIGDIFLAGWACWKDTGDVGLAKNRMVSRTSNLIRDRRRQQGREKRTQSLAVMADQGVPELADHRHHGQEAAFEQHINERLASFSERDRQIVQLRIAGFTDEEIATEMQVSLRTVERTFTNIRKGLKDADAK